jgi:RNA 2',3'-cyclic 3'-phosphodiesterase
LSAAETRRIFFAVWLAPEAAQAMHRTAVLAQQGCGGRAMRPETLHVTLAFLGDVSPAQLAVATAIADGIEGKEFFLTLDRLGYWKHNRILWAGADSPPLLALADVLSSGLRTDGFSIDNRPFAPHVTLLRDARCPNTPQLSTAVNWPVREFVLAESRRGAAGSHYEILGRWRLS